MIGAILFLGELFFGKFACLIIHYARLGTSDFRKKDLLLSCAAFVSTQLRLQL